MSERSTDPRSRRLGGLFARVVSGRQMVTNPASARLFLEAICEQPDPAICIQRMVGTDQGLIALRSALCIDVSIPALNGPITKFLQYLQAPALKSICGGDVLQQVVLKIVDPPLIWDKFVEAIKAGHIDEDGLEAFSWLLLQAISLPIDKAMPCAAVVGQDEIRVKLLECSRVGVRARVYRSLHIVDTITTVKRQDTNGPGGRHDNDFADIHKIAILPTPDELTSKDPFLRRAIDVQAGSCGSDYLALHIDNQFRLLREDMLRSLREEVEAARSSNKGGRRRILCIKDLGMVDVLCDGRQPWSLQLQCIFDLPQLMNKSIASRKRFLKENPKFLKNRSVACLVADQDVVALATLVRDDELLARIPPILCLQLSEAATARTLLRIKTAGNIKLLHLSTAVFAYEPFLLQLKQITELSLEDDILHWEKGKELPKPSYGLSKELTSCISRLENDFSMDLQQALDLPRPTRLDRSQAQCFMAGLRQRLSLVQGPPGTGKSFIGSMIAKAIYKHSTQTLLVVCYTHHALDQSLEDLLDSGIPSSDIVRLGDPAKATMRTKPLSLTEMWSKVRFSHEEWKMRKFKKCKVDVESTILQADFHAFQRATINKSDVMEYLSFQPDGLSFFEAFEMPEEADDMVRVGKRGKKISEFYLLDRWCCGMDAGIYREKMEGPLKLIWDMDPQKRLKEYGMWKNKILSERAASVHESGAEYNALLGQITAINMERDLKIIRTKRVIGCTTTKAAKYVKALQSISPGVLLMEEAGEILESHVLTVLGPETKQLVLIGDHKQLRPKAHYDLSVEKGEGYDLNRSLFERLVLKGYPHHFLSQQHRMRPELSALVRNLTYPDLIDAPGTQGRPNLKGFLDNLIFLNHNKEEADLPDVPDWRDNTSRSSKRNLFEANMTLKCVRYLGQQGYRSDNIVVLTPYLGQLRLLLDELGKDNDPVLNDLDSYDLVRAGLMPAASAHLKKPRIRTSTIDNYQGEESDIVISSLTRSNSRGDIGFMSSPERLNVMLSRARNALIIIGDAETFMGSRKGEELWGRFMSVLKAGNHVYDGFPVKCERHPDRTLLLRLPEDFDQHCPDGGCSEPCGTMLQCGLHKCPQRCHQLYDHSKMPCERIVEFKCPNGHAQKSKCHANAPGTCQTCWREAERRQRDLQSELERQSNRDREQAEHAAAIAEVDRKVRLVREEMADRHAAEERTHALEQKERDLQTAKRLVEEMRNMPSKIERIPSPGQSPRAMPSLATIPNFQAAAGQERAVSGGSNEMRDEMSAPEKEWDRQKRVDGASNDAINAFMSLTGLEDAKAKILAIKAKIETVLRQATDMKNERLGIVLLGNPGTGKTTVARLYAQFLASIGVLPGTEFVETTGSRIASEGVAGAKKHVEKILNGGGGAFFLDEAYQLAGGNNPGGASVLDFLLAEIENRVGKIVFILAGYSREMERFFEHNPGFDSRMPHRLHFADYTDKELLLMLSRLVEKKYNGRAKLEDGINGLYARIAVRRLGRGRGREGYGNARALENVWSKITERQASRLHRERAAGSPPDDFLFTKEDLIGPEPSAAILKSAAWEKLQSLIGLEAVKDSIRGLIDRIQLNYERELEEMPPVEVSLNRIFLGSPGTGKTSVGHLYGEILADIGLLSKREVVVKNPADFIGGVLGESEKNTKAILKASEGKVLIIDEAYMLYPGSKGVGNASDPYRTAVIDTIVAEVQSTPGEDRCVLLLGYRKEMEEMLENTNPGLARRFPLEYAFEFEDFDDQQLRQILELKLKAQGLDATEGAKDVAVGILARARDRPNFGNAGEVENLISYAKAQEQRRQSMETKEKRSPEIVFLPSDFDENFDRSKNAALACRELFADVVGCESLIEKLERYQRRAANLRSRGHDPKSVIPFNFIFKGPPGTGKTTTARKMGQMFYHLGLLSTEDYLECSASDLIGHYVGQTGPKTTAVLKKGLGKVLFVDEAYRLAEGQFAKEAVDELVDNLTKPQFSGKMVVILAGYTENMNTLLGANPGLSSRFPEEITFESMTPIECLTLLQRHLKGSGVEFVIPESRSTYYNSMINLFEKLCSLPSWGNGRDVKTLSKSITGTVFDTAEDSKTELIAPAEVVLTELGKMYKAQKDRCEVKSAPAATQSNSRGAIARLFDLATDLPSARATATSTSSANQAGEPAPAPAEIHQGSQSDAAVQEPQRDPTVSDEIWAQLQADMEANELADQRSQVAIADLEQLVESSAANEETVTQEVAVLEAAAAARVKPSTDGEDDEKRRRHEEVRLREVMACRARQEAEEKLRKAKEEEEQRRRQEVAVQRKLRDMGVCPAGYRWIKQRSGYRCGGGSHFVSNSELGL